VFNYLFINMYEYSDMLPVHTHYVSYFI